MMMAARLIYRGAEADLFGGDWAGQKAVFKFRKPLPYRLEVLDSSIRGQRTVHEAQMLRAARVAGVLSPHVYYVSQSEALIVMEYLVGRQLKTTLASSEREEVECLSRLFGKSVGRLHSAGIMHGDLTTSNVVVQDGGIRLLDFGLAAHTWKVEDQAVDLRLIKEILLGAHSSVSALVLSSFLEGYGTQVGERRAAEVLRNLREIERRGRYSRVE